MSSAHAIDDKIYAAAPDHKLSMLDLLDYFSKHGGSLRISDLHLKVGGPPVYRLDGQLQKMNGAPLDAPTVQALIASIMTDAELETLEKNRAVDGSYFSANMQFRLNAFHDSDGLAIAVRALEPTPLPVENIGFPNNVWRDIISKQWGLVLLTGITGAGKSTTIASLIDRIAQTRPCRIITLEDPVEYRLTGKKAVISQREVGRDVPSYERGLRDCLREDPDIIFVGEMRDKESARWTLTAAETGHLVFSSLHTRDARGSITRILDMFPPDQKDEIASQLSLGLSHIISQKLIPRANGEGRVVAMEILNNTYAIANLTRLQKTELIYSHLQTKTKDVPEERMMSMERSLVQLVRAGQVSPFEAEKWANHPTAFLDELNRAEARNKE